MSDIDDIKPADEDTTVDSIKVTKGLSLKALTKQQRDVCIRTMIEQVTNAQNLESTIGKQGDFNVAILFSANPESIASMINAVSIPTINKYIENTLNSKVSNYNRSMILFESEIQKDKLFIRWSS